jgi:hypothetical protein
LHPDIIFFGRTKKMMKKKCAPFAIHSEFFGACGTRSAQITCRPQTVLGDGPENRLIRYSSLIDGSKGFCNSTANMEY